MNSIQWFDWGLRKGSNIFDEYNRYLYKDAIIGLKGLDANDFTKIEVTFWFGGEYKNSGAGGWLEVINKSFDKFPNTSFYRHYSKNSSNFLWFDKEAYAAPIEKIEFKFCYDASHANVVDKFNKKYNYNTYSYSINSLFLELYVPIENGKTLLDYSIKLSDKIYYYEFDFTK